MDTVRKYSINILKEKLLGKRANFKSDCQLFPNFNVTGKVVNITMVNNIPLIEVILQNGRHFRIDGGMTNLTFTLI